MRVNSNLTGLFTFRLVRSGIALMMIAIFLIGSSFTKPSNRDLRVKQVNLIIRLIGHQLLLQAGDYTSRVLPVTETREGTFLLTFENEFVFSHDSLMVLSEGLLPKSLFPSGYTVTVLDCMSAGIVYGFQVNNTSPDILPCGGRSEPSGCYKIEFAFPDFYQELEQKMAVINQPSEEVKSVKVIPQKANPKLEDVETKTFDNDIDQLIQELKSFKVDSLQANPKLEEVKTTNFDYPVIKLVYGGMLVLLGVTFLIGRFGKLLAPLPAHNHDHAIIKEPVPGLPALSKFLFDVKGQRLLSGHEVINLTDKECRILELLNESFGELIPRETLMQKIWINDGVITGRSLDMFISKLRKKLSSDPDLRITNVHGKGYKLEVQGTQIS